MKLAYIAGPYRAKNGRTVLQNCRAAERVAIKYWKLGYSVICPHKNTEFFDGLMPDQTWLDGDLEIIKRIDVLVLMTNWAESLGCQDELRQAEALGKEIIYDDGKE